MVSRYGDSKTVDLIMFMGQSNMAGRGDNLDNAPSVIDGAGWEYRSVTAPDTLSPVVEPFGVNEIRGTINETTKTGSMTTSFINSYYQTTKVPVVGVSASMGGTNINYWTSHSANVQEYTKRYNDCVNYLNTSGYKIRKKLCVFCQGESNGDLGTTKDAYKTLLNDFCYYRMKKDLGIDMTFIIRIGRNNGGGTKYNEQYSEIQKAQFEYCNESPYAVLVGTVFDSMLERGMMKDQFHYTQIGYNEQGEQAGKNVGAWVNGIEKPIQSLHNILTNGDGYKDGLISSRNFEIQVKNQSGTATATMLQQQGYYYRIGDLVYIRVFVQISNKNGINDSDKVVIHSLPYPLEPLYESPLSVMLQGGIFGGATKKGLLASVNGKQITLAINNIPDDTNISSSVPLTGADISNSFYVMISGTFINKN